MVNISTSDALIDIIECVTDSLDTRDKCSIISIDLKKAFDTIDHSILIKKLHLYGIMDTALNLIISYVNNRKQYVNTHHANSTLLDINCGVPRGSFWDHYYF